MGITMSRITSRSVTYKQVTAVKLTRWEGAGPTWKGVPHKNLLTEMSSALTRVGFQPALENGIYTLSRNDADLTAIIPTGSWGHSFICLVSSNAGRKALQFYGGERVADTMIVTYQFGGFPSWEYTEEMKLDEVAEEAAKIYLKNANDAYETIGILKQFNLSEKDARKILFETAVRGWVSFNRMGKIWKWWSYRRGTGMDLMDAYCACWLNGWGGLSRPTPRLDILRKTTDLILTTGQILSSKRKVEV